MAVQPRAQVLSVDDEVNILKAIKRTLRRSDMDVTMAESGAAALAAMADQNFDVILSDMRMPQMNGAEFLAKAAELQPRARRVLLSGYSDINLVADAINSGGVCAFLTKPWNDEQLLRVVEESVRITRLEDTVTNLTCSYNSMVALLGNIAELRDSAGCTLNAQKVELALAMADQLALDDGAQQTLEQSVHLHRIGRLMLPAAVLAKPFVQLTAQERQQVDQHPVYAETVLMGVPGLDKVANIICHQSERWDGQGFPDSLSEDAIPMESRILAVVRDYADLRSGLYDATAMSKEEALTFLSQQVGSRYDPQVLGALTQIIKASILENP